MSFPFVLKTNGLLLEEIGGNWYLIDEDTEEAVIELGEIYIYDSFSGITAAAEGVENVHETYGELGAEEIERGGGIYNNGNRAGRISGGGKHSISGIYRSNVQCGEHIHSGYAHILRLSGEQLQYFGAVESGLRLQLKEHPDTEQNYFAVQRHSAAGMGAWSSSGQRYLSYVLHQQLHQQSVCGRI